MGRGAEGCWGERDFPVIATGSLFTCLQGSQPSEWAFLALLLGLVSEDRPGPVEFRSWLALPLLC